MYVVFYLLETISLYSQPGPQVRDMFLVCPRWLYQDQDLASVCVSVYIIQVMLLWLTSSGYMFAAKLCGSTYSYGIGYTLPPSYAKVLQTVITALHLLVVDFWMDPHNNGLAI